MQDESFVTQAAVYQVVQQQLQAQTAELDKARKIMEGLQRECEGYKHSIQGLVQQVCGVHHISAKRFASCACTSIFNFTCSSGARGHKSFSVSLI